MKRTDYIDKQTFFMKLAELASKRSKDPNTQVGAVIVADDDRILSLGYNGFPNGIDDDKYPWDREAEKEIDTKYPYVVHAELNAILNYKGSHRDLKGSTLYVSLFPCHECAKAIIQSGIKKVVYSSNKYEDTDDHKESIRMLTDAGVELYQYVHDVMIPMMEITHKLGVPAPADIREAYHEVNYISNHAIIF